MEKRASSHNTRWSKIRRRSWTVTRELVLWVVLTALSPVLLALAILVDLARWARRRTPWMAVRLVAMAWIFLTVDIIGVLWMFAGWLASGFGKSRDRLMRYAYATQRWWARVLLRATVRLLRLRLSVTGEEQIQPGPILAIFRHASLIDNLLPIVYIMDKPRIKLRWVIKREMLSFPAIDIGGLRLPNYFVDRKGGGRDELRNIAALTKDLGPEDGLLIYPEGTRATAEKRQRAAANIKDPQIRARAESLRHVLPPRLGGTMTMLAAGVDVVVCSHVGLGGFATVGDVWSGALVGRTINITFWRVPVDEIPTDRSGRITWLYDQWDRIDQYIEDMSSAGLAD